MNLFKNPILAMMGLLALALLVIAGCSDTPEDPQANVEPNTIITTYGINTAPDTASIFTVTVYWRASDPDGQPEFYRYWVGDINMPDADKHETFETQVSVSLDFPSAEDSYAFNVQARDNRGVWDSTPATVQVSISDTRRGSTYSPNTLPITVPVNGSNTSRGVHFVIGGSDLDGTIPTFEYAIDSPDTWVEVVPQFILDRQSTLELDLTPVELSLGPHILYVRAVDNYGNVDESPLTISFVAVDFLRPDLSVVSGAIPGAFYFLPQGGTTVDLTTTWSADATWYYSTLLYRFTVDDTTAWSDWQTDNFTTSTGLVAGAHTFFVQAMDQGGGISTFSTEFGIGQLTGDRGILVVNGIDWGTYTPQPENMYAANGPFGTQPFHFWDLFEGQSSYYPANIAAVFEGSGAIPGDSLGRYSSVVMMMNAFGGDEELFGSMLPLIMSYLNGGGNVLLAGRFGANFIKGELLTYGLSEGNTLEFNEIGVNPSSGGLVAAVEGLVTIAGTGSWSLTDLLAPPTDPAVTVLFTTPSYAGSVGGIIVEPAGKGKFAFVAGRTYRFNFTAMAADFDYILDHYFGE